MKRSLIAMTVLLSLGAAAPAMAQDVQFDADAIAAACSGDAANCASVVKAQLAALKKLGLPADVFNSQLAALAATTLASVDPAAGAAVLAQVSGAITEIASVSTDPQQAASLTKLAQSVQSGDTKALTAFAKKQSKEEKKKKGDKGKGRDDHEDDHDDPPKESDN